MSDSPCEHWDHLTGTVSAGSLDKSSGKFVSVVTCDDCKVASAGYVQMKTGLPANNFEPFGGPHV
ncbi:hypothetical protein HOT72_gp075 [Gordonia phage Apricot]|uniref:Uncharacterized protein n=1 Tax=Gordonia phage Apricot TaxID=2250319 RepID=A0A345L182_9CAUD|nr:hypothetical protein HOT72_gp075 [Gordonia phage Apricot]AXH49034.1 hypothetical protein SEA_APRICOT_75 [Gordonia phage Apricot]UTN91541.1 hypothetical protein SEA_PERIWINKLE_87 [Gordonia phage Periwinkle]